MSLSPARAAKLTAAILAFLLLMLTFGLTQTSAEGSEAVDYTLADAALAASRLTDDDVMSRINTDKLVLSFEPHDALLCYLEWYALPDAVSFIEYNASDDIINETKYTPAKFCESIALSPETTKIAIRADSKFQISKLQLYSNALPEDTLLLSFAPEKTDLLFYLASPTTLFEQFSALLPLYAVEHDVVTTIVIEGYEHRYQCAELERAAFELGYSTAPVYLGLEYNIAHTYAKAYGSLTNSKVYANLVAFIRTSRPEVIVTHDLNSENVYEKATAEVLLLAVADAANSALYPEIPTWQVKKLYTLGGVGTTSIRMDKASTSYVGKTVLEKTQECYRYCSSRQLYHYAISDSLTLSLAYSFVGSESDSADILQNIGITSLQSYDEAIPTAEPTAEPTIEPTAEPTIEPTPTEEPTEQPTLPPVAIETVLPAEIDRPAESPSFWWLFAVLGAGLAVGLFLLLRKRSVALAVILAAVVLLAGLLTALFMLFESINVEDEAEQPVPTFTPLITEEPTPTAAPTTEPTAEPTDEPTFTPEPTASPAPTASLFEQTHADEGKFDEHFTDYGADEVVEWDDVNGVWMYRSDILAVEIRREITTVTVKGKSYPQVNFYAHIYMRDFDTFRPAFATDAQSGTETCLPESFIRYKPVLLITGDNIINSDVEKKGVLIRDGRVYSQEQNDDCMAFYPNDLSFTIFRKRTMKAYDILESGAENCFSFGPGLIFDGVIRDKLDSIGSQANPRCGLGMVEPGHWVAIISDGRQAEYSLGLSLKQFAQLFYDEGCTQAFNLDGGVSTCIMFMGVQLNQHSGNKEDKSWQRTLPDALMWGYSELVSADNANVEPGQ